MEVFLVSILVIEIVFLILGNCYLNKSKHLKILDKYILVLMYYVVFILFNVSLVSVVVRNYFDLTSLNNDIKTLQSINEEYNSKLEKLDSDIVSLKEELNSLNYVNIKEESENFEKEKTEYEDELKDLEEEKNSLDKKLNDLNETYEKLEEQTKFIINDFPTFHQFPNYPNGCESVALYLMLKYHNVDVTVEEIVEKLKKGDAPFRKDGVLYGRDPEVEFVGDPRLKSGYGVYEKPILDVSEYYKSGMKNITGSSLDRVLEIVKSGKPVQVWASINLKNTYVCAKWQSTSTDRIVEWKCGLHSLVVIGFTYDKIITSDPYTGKIEYYSKTQFEKMYNTYGKRAIYYE